MAKNRMKLVFGVVIFGIVLGLGGGCDGASTQPSVAAEWKLAGGAEVDGGHDRPGGVGHAVRIPPRGSAIWEARKTNGSGKVEIWVYDDLTKQENPKVREAGPRWGLLDESGRQLLAGVFYAPYLAGDLSYAIADFDGGNIGGIFTGIQFSALERDDGWHKWTFDFDEKKGLSIYLDDENKARFDWSKTGMAGFSGVVAFGDSAANGGQTIWISEGSASLGPAMKAKPGPDETGLFQVPAVDPVEAQPIDLLPGVRKQHPRLLFGPEDIPGLIAKAKGPGKIFYDQLMKYLPACNAPTGTTYLTNATDAQRVGAWQLPTVAFHYVLTKDRRSLDRASKFLTVLCKQDHWELGGEIDSGMAAANIMVGVALTYDWLYNDLDPQLRDTVRAKLLLQARRMYYYGHLQKRGGDTTHYWQQDTQNNHRWHRDAGLVLATLAVADGEADSEWLLARTKQELELVAQWLPPDGSSHESSSYQAFGMPYLGLAFDSGSRCLIGPSLLQNHYFEHLAMFRIQTLLPGLADAFNYGDSGGTGFINSFDFKCTSVFQQQDLQAGLDAFYRARPAAFTYGWFSLIWYDPKVTVGSVDQIPLTAYFPDLGMSFFRDGWKAQNVGLMFKCCPYGGATLNAYRNANGSHYINVAHDDPDANMFELYSDRQFVAEDDRYAAHKLTSSHNTILVDGKGQIGEGQVFTQPLNGDMLKMAYITASRLDGPIAAAEGEAGNSYKGLTRFRRGVYWSDHRYILILDDIEADEPHDLAWLVQAKQVSVVDAKAGQFQLGYEKGGCPLQILSEANPDFSIVPSTAEDHGKTLGFQQLRASVHTHQWKLLSVFDPWHTHPHIKADKNSPLASFSINIDNSNAADLWHWGKSVSNDVPSQVFCERDGKTIFSWGNGVNR